MSSDNNPILKMIALDKLVPGKQQPRHIFDEQDLRELVDAIKTLGGVLQPLTVRPLENGKYEIITGERRSRAAKLAGLTEVSCIIKDYDDEKSLQAAIIENTSRADLNPIEQAEAYQKLIDKYSYRHEEIANMLGKSRVEITNTIRLLRLIPSVREMIMIGVLTESHGKVLASLNSKDQKYLAVRCVGQEWSVRKLEQEMRRLLASREKASNDPYANPNLQALEEELSQHIGSTAHIQYDKKGGGFLKIRFDSINELKKHFARLGFLYQH